MKSGLTLFDAFVQEIGLEKYKFHIIDENLGIYHSISHETWQSGSSNAPTKTYVGILKISIFCSVTQRERLKNREKSQFQTFRAAQPAKE